MLPSDWLVPQWPAPARVKAFMTTRQGGVSSAPYATLNLGTRVGDDAVLVAQNRARVRAHLPADPKWLRQVHGTQVVAADTLTGEPEADAAYTRSARVVCVVQAADCLPVLFCDEAGTCVAAAHAGWRGLGAGVLERAIHALAQPPETLLAWLGAAIGPSAFEVGSDVLAAYPESANDARSFTPAHASGKWFANLFLLARKRLAAAGVSKVFGGELCTYSDPTRFFSHRRDHVGGRQAAFIWLE